MAKEEALGTGYVKKGAVFWVAGVALVAGFLMGVVFSAYKSPQGLPVPSSMPAPPAPLPADEHKPSAEMAARILELEKQIAQNKEDADFWTQLGHLYFDTDSYEKAIDAYQKSLTIRPDNADIWNDLGVMYRRNGKPAEAIKAFDKAAEVDPRHETSRFNKGIVLMHELKDIPGAVKAWEELVRINPNAKTPGGQLVSEIIEQFKHRRKP